MSNKSVFLLFILLLPNFKFQNQDYNRFKRELNTIYIRIEESLLDEEEVEYLQDDAEELLNDLEDFLKNNKSLPSLERSKLLELEEELELLGSFFFVIDKTNGQLEKEDFYRIIEKIGGVTSSFATDNSCALILKIQIGDFRALFFENLTKSTSYKVSYKFLDKRYNLVSKSGEMGLIRRNIRHIVNSRDNEDFDQLKFQSLTCEIIDYPF